MRNINKRKNKVSIVEETLKVLADSNKLELTEVNKMYIEAYQILESRGLKENLERLALNGVKNTIRKLLRKSEFVPKAKAIEVVGFVVGDGGLWDKIEIMRSKVRRYIEKNGIEAAIEANLINGDNQILDTREKIFGKENPHFLEPIERMVNGKMFTIKDRSRTLHLIAKLYSFSDKDYEDGKTPPEPEYKYGTIQTNDPSLAVGWGKVKFFIPCQTHAIVKEDPEGMNGFKLNSSIAEETLSIFKAIKDETIDVDKIFMNTITPELTSIGEVEKHHEAFRDVWDRIIFVRGIVAWINRDRVSPIGTISMGLMDADTDDMVTVNIPEHIPTDFGEQSEVIVIGKTKRQDLREEDEEGKVHYVKGEGQVVIDAVGIYPLKGLTTPVDLNRVEVLGDEKEIEGWLD